MSSSTPPRFRDPGHPLHVVSGEILVVCPRCEGCARTIRRDLNGEGWAVPRRLVCSCGYSQDWNSSSGPPSAGRGPHDDYFHRPLWLQTPCAGHTVWAYNAEHLAMLEGFIGATLREHRRDATTGWSNQSLLGRLPRWMQAAKHRDDVLRALHKLRELLPEPTS